MTRFLIVLLTLSCAACGPIFSGRAPAAVESVNVFAASSLTDSFKALGASFHAAHPDVTVRFNFAGSPTLVTQIENGAQADVFASADTANMDKLVSDGFSAAFTPAIFAHNQLEIVVGPGNPKGIYGLADLARPGIVYISAAPSVPAGKYASQVLAKAGVAAKPKSLETDVKAVVGKIELGEADAGIVYTTDVKSAGSKVSGVEIPPGYNVVATYPITIVKGTPNFAAANNFVAFVVSAAGQARLKDFGFLPA